MITIRKEFRFEMAHQLFNSYSAACHQNLHGHSYVLELFFTTTEYDKLDETGMVVDFGEVKAIAKDYIDGWDHSLVMPKMFPEEYLNMLAKYTKKFQVTDYNPTAENMSKDIFQKVGEMVKNYQVQKYGKVNWTISKVRLHETTTGYAEYC